jgi:hypothetical protein
MDDATFNKLLAEGEQNRYDFLRTDLELCHTFVDLARTELDLGEREAADRILGKAETGYATILRLHQGLENVNWKHEIGMKLIELRTTIDVLKSNIKPSKFSRP